MFICYNVTYLNTFKKEYTTLRTVNVYENTQVTLKKKKFFQEYVVIKIYSISVSYFFITMSHLAKTPPLTRHKSKLVLIFPIEYLVLFY